MKPRPRRKPVVTDLDLEEPKPNVIEMIAVVAARDDDAEKIDTADSNPTTQLSGDPET
ncbi:MAG: hypothetical protein JNL21_07340 [Myxococcales bacterium]|nr:hypothetical protein [Myxococcales bacterium]